MLWGYLGNSIFTIIARMFWEIILRIQPHGQYHALKTKRISSEKAYGPKIHKWVTNCQGPYTIIN